MHRALDTDDLGIEERDIPFHHLKLERLEMDVESKVPTHVELRKPGELYGERCSIEPYGPF